MLFQPFYGEAHFLVQRYGSAVMCHHGELQPCQGSVLAPPLGHFKQLTANPLPAIFLEDADDDFRAMADAPCVPSHDGEWPGQLPFGSSHENVGVVRADNVA